MVDRSNQVRIPMPWHSNSILGPIPSTTLRSSSVTDTPNTARACETSGAAGAVGGPDAASCRTAPRARRRRAAQHQPGLGPPHRPPHTLGTRRARPAAGRGRRQPARDWQPVLASVRVRRCSTWWFRARATCRLAAMLRNSQPMAMPSITPSRTQAQPFINVYGISGSPRTSGSCWHVLPHDAPPLGTRRGGWPACPRHHRRGSAARCRSPGR